MEPFKSSGRVKNAKLVADVISQLFAQLEPKVAQSIRFLHICSVDPGSSYSECMDRVFIAVPDAKWPCMSAASKDLASLITLLGRSGDLPPHPTPPPCCYSSISYPHTCGPFSLSGISVINRTFLQLPICFPFCHLKRTHCLTSIFHQWKLRILSVACGFNLESIVCSVSTCIPDH